MISAIVLASILLIARFGRGFIANISVLLGIVIGGVLATLARLLDSGAIQVYVDSVYDLADAARAHREIERGHSRGKIVLRVGDA